MNYSIFILRRAQIEAIISHHQQKECAALVVDAAA